MARNSGRRIIDGSVCLKDLDGCELQWWSYVVSHGEFRLLCKTPEGGLLEILFGATQYVDCLSQMHNVRLRVATEEETEALRQHLPPSLVRDLQREDHLIIECTEGTYCVWAEAMVIRFVEQPDYDHLEAISGSLWPGGPPLADL